MRLQPWASTVTDSAVVVAEKRVDSGAVVAAAVGVL